MKIQKTETCFKKQFFWKKYETQDFISLDIQLENKLIILYPDIKYQTILGFGGAFTEASGYAISRLPKKQYDNAIKEYFSPEGLNYSFCRTPINSCDFSLDSYAYLQKPDLSTFSIERDKKYLIPMILAAQNRQSKLQLLASPWSPPFFMKTNQKMIEGGKLLDEFKQLWANYLVRYVREYESLGISIQYMTIQNEPKAVQTWESCLYNPQEEADLVRNYLYPTFQNAHKQVQFLIWDHNKERVFYRSKSILDDFETRKIVSGIAFHWYSGDHFENLKLVKQNYPEKLLIATEGCTGYSQFRTEDEIMNAEIYAHDYLGNLNSGVNGQIDWNLFLDNQGGPNHKQNYCNSPIMMNKDNSNYIKNLSYYYIGHFSKFIKPGAKCIAHSKYTNKIEVTSFQNPDNCIIIVVLNRTDEMQDYYIAIEEQICHDEIKPHSIITYEIK